jgi:hypothetical protein
MHNFHIWPGLVCVHLVHPGKPKAVGLGSYYDVLRRSVVDAFSLSQGLHREGGDFATGDGAEVDYF